jgi:chemotaxis protein MotB
MTMAAHVVIIKKKKRGHGGHHGGAWKVAYADFVTAMMAFFLVMWLVGQKASIKAGVAGYFRDPAAFDGGAGILNGGKGPLDAAPEQTKGPGSDGANAQRAALEQSVSHIREKLNSLPELKTLNSQIEFVITDEGLRIDLLEASKSSFFDSGSASMRPETARILAIIGHELATLDSAIILEGYTDSHPYASREYSNWELSADRANAARRVMEQAGVKPAHIAGVRGHADRELKVPEDPFDPRNRRVSVIVKNH